MTSNKRVVLLARNSFSTKCIYNAIKNNCEVVAVVIEQKESTWQFYKRRINKVGWLQVAGQIVFQATIPKILKTKSASRLNEIKKEYQLVDAEIDNNLIINIDSINNVQVQQLLLKHQPDMVMLSGTRIVSKKILSTVNCNFINIHAGITPLYRGVHGAYWALYNNDYKNCGVTLHVVDAGIDTGGIIQQSQIALTPKDNFITYPVLQLASGIQMLNHQLQNLFSQPISTVPAPQGESKLYYHPTIFQYVKALIFKKLK